MITKLWSLHAGPGPGAWSVEESTRSGRQQCVVLDSRLLPISVLQCDPARPAASSTQFVSACVIACVREGVHVVAKTFLADPSALTQAVRFLRECLLMRLLRQSLAVVPLSGPANESFFAVRDAARSFACIGFTMRQAETDLFTLLAARRRLSKPPIEEADAAELLAPIVVSLRAFHAVGIVHRDVKPANIFFFDEESNARLGDFGLSRQILPASGCDLEAEAHFPQCINQNCDDRSPPSDYVCTRWYRAPELLVTDDPGYRQHWAAPTAVDMWALGCVLFELLLSPSASAPASRTAGFLPTIPKGANGILFPGPDSPGPQLETIHRVLAGRQSQPQTVSFWEAATGRSLTSDACAVLDALLTLDPAARATAGVLEEMAFFRAHVAAPHVAELGPSIARALTPEVLAEHTTLLTASTLDWDSIVALLPTVIPSDRVETLPPAAFGEISSLPGSHKAVSPGRAGPCCAIV